MIDLRIDDICKECPEFEVTQEDLHYGTCKHVILTCEHIHKCRNIRRHLEQKEADNDKN